MAKNFGPEPVAQFRYARHNRAILSLIAPLASMNRASRLLDSLRGAGGGRTLADLLELHLDVPRRTAQRWLARLVADGKVRAEGKGRARRYHAIAVAREQREAATGEDAFPADIPLSPDSRDILAYVDQPLQARKPVGYERDFLDAYRPNRSWYLPAPLRRQLRAMGNTGREGLPAGTYGRAILDRLLIDLSWASSHLEGNTYTRLDTRALLEHGRVAQGKGAVETQMILNHKSAIELLVENADVASFNRYTILNLHSALSENLLPNPADEGRLRQHAVEIGKSVYRPLAAPAQISETFDAVLEKAGRIEDPFEQSFFVMVHLPYLQPFADVNKRLSRLAANLPLIRDNLCPLTFLDVPERAYNRAVLGVYELTRVELLRDLYVWAYERSTQEYLAIKRDLIEPDPLRLAHRDVIKSTIREVVTHPGEDALAIIRDSIEAQVAATDRAGVQALVLEEMRRLHEGMLARYGLRPSEFAAWKASQKAGE